MKITNDWTREYEAAGRIGDFRNNIGVCSVCGGHWLSMATLSWDRNLHRLRCMDCWALGPARRSKKRAAQLFRHMWKVRNGERIRQMHGRAIVGAAEGDR